MFDKSNYIVVSYITNPGRAEIMDKDKIRDITVEILVSIRDEIRHLREDTNKRFEQMDKRLESIETDMRAIVAHFERDYILLANKMGAVEERLETHIQQAHT